MDEMKRDASLFSSLYISKGERHKLDYAAAYSNKQETTELEI